MGNYEQLKEAISAVIKTNGNNEITGAILQDVLLTMISTIGYNATFAGIATTTTVPANVDENVFYLATETGTYSNFGALSIRTGRLNIITNRSGAWVTTPIDVPSYDEFANNVMSAPTIKPSGFYSYTTGDFVNSASGVGTRHIAVVPYHFYKVYLNATPNEFTIQYAYYDQNKIYISGGTFLSSEEFYIDEPDARYITLSVAASAIPSGQRLQQFFISDLTEFYTIQDSLVSEEVRSHFLIPRAPYHTTTRKVYDDDAAHGFYGVQVANRRKYVINLYPSRTDAMDEVPVPYDVYYGVVVSWDGTYIPIQPGSATRPLPGFLDFTSRAVPQEQDTLTLYVNLQRNSTIKYIEIIDVTDEPYRRDILQDNIQRVLGVETPFKIVLSTSFPSPEIYNNLPVAWGQRRSNTYYRLRFVPNFEGNVQLYIMLPQIGNNFYNYVLGEFEAHVQVPIETTVFINNKEDFVGFGFSPVEPQYEAGKTAVLTISENDTSAIPDSFLQSVIPVTLFGDRVVYPEVESAGSPGIYPVVYLQTYMNEILGKRYATRLMGVDKWNLSNVLAMQGGMPFLLKYDITFTADTLTQTFADCFVVTDFSGEVPADIVTAGTSAISSGIFDGAEIDGHAVGIAIVDGGVRITLKEELSEGMSVVLPKGSMLYVPPMKWANEGRLVLFVGANGITRYSSYMTLPQELQNQVSRFTSNSTPKAIVCSMFMPEFAGDGTFETYKAAAEAALEEMIEIEKNLFSMFGVKFVNLRKELVNHGLQYAVEGGYLPESALTNENNLECISKGIVPFGNDHTETTPAKTSEGLLINYVPNQAGYYAIARIIANVITKFYTDKIE